VMTSQYGILQTISAFHLFLSWWTKLLYQSKSALNNLGALRRLLVFCLIRVNLICCHSPDACAALRQHCHNLKQILSSRIDSSSTETDAFNSFESVVTDRVSDTDGVGLFDELRTMCNILPDTVKSPLDILRYVHASFTWASSKCFRGVANFANSSSNRSFRRTFIFKT